MLNNNIQFPQIWNLFIAIGLIIVTSSPVAAMEMRDIQKVVARVNEVPIYGTELAAAAESRKQYRQLNSKVTDDGSQRRYQLKDLDELITRELLAQAGAALKLQNIEEKLAKRMESYSGSGGQKTLQTEKQPLAPADQLRKDILRDSYLEHKGLLNPKADEQATRRFYDENLQSFVESKSVKAHHILIRLPKTPTAVQQQEAQNKAGKILADLKQGKDFASLATQSSDCSSKNDGGNLGFIKQGFMPKDFDAIAFTLKLGETSGVVKTRHGLHIIRIEESRPEAIREFKEVKGYIAGYVQKDYQRRKVDELVKELRKSAKIEVLIQ